MKVRWVRMHREKVLIHEQKFPEEIGDFDALVFFAKQVSDPHNERVDLVSDASDRYDPSPEQLRAYLLTPDES